MSLSDAFMEIDIPRLSNSMFSAIYRMYHGSVDDTYTPMLRRDWQRTGDLPHSYSIFPLLSAMKSWRVPEGSVS